jgi:hypothetical protein
LHLRELGRAAATKAHAVHTFGADLHGSVLDIKGRTAEGMGIQNPDDWRCEQQHLGGDS